MVSASEPPTATARPSLLRAWFYLVWLSWQRQLRARQMVWIAIGLLVFAVVLTAVYTAQGRWSMNYWRYPSRSTGLTFRQWSFEGQVVIQALDPTAMGQAIESAAFGSFRAILRESRFIVFSRWMVFSIFLSFLLPLWSLSFATEALGNERESGSLIWLTSRPLPRPLIYLAKFVAVLPWCLAFNVGGFALICLTAGEPGLTALRLFWPAVVLATLAFAALFFLLGACFRRAAVLALVYSFFLETLLGNMPGQIKRVSIGFYTRCLMFDAAEQYGIQPEKPGVYLPVDGTTAFIVLVSLTVGLVVIGMAVFSRMQFQDGA